jgi:predicted nucleotidyltransferase
VKNLRVFGSVARGEDDEKSDVDLLVEFPPGFTLFDHGGIIIELEDLLGCKVDIGSDSSLKPRIKEKVLREAIPL